MIVNAGNDVSVYALSAHRSFQSVKKMRRAFLRGVRLMREKRV